jgi:hypothetical protein
MHCTTLLCIEVVCSAAKCSTVQYTVQIKRAVRTVHLIRLQHSAVQYSTVRYHAVHYSVAQCSAVQYSTVPCSTLQCSTVQYSTVPCSTLQCSTAQYSTVQYSTLLYSAVRAHHGIVLQHPPQRS